MATIAQIAAADDRFDVLVAALGFVDAELPGTNLLATLAAPRQDLTVFAPTDEAFAGLAATLGFDGPQTDAGVAGFLTSALGAETLRDVILYHVAAGTQTAAAIDAAGSVHTLNGEDLGVDLPTLVDAEPDLADPSIIAADVGADNGIVHVIDGVLLPFDLPGFPGIVVPTIAEIVAASGPFDRNPADFDVLLRAVQTAGLTDALDDAGAELTVFAPTDGAFLATAMALGFGGGSESAAFDHIVRALTLLSGGEDPVPLLTDVLLYHVAGEALPFGEIEAQGGVTTLLGIDLTLSGNRLVDGEPDLPNPRLIQADRLAENGIVHTIDGVLLPLDLLQSDGAGDVQFILAGNRDNHIVTRLDADLVAAGGGDDAVILGAGTDVGLGEAGDDTLAGGAGDDILRGGQGEDLLLGGHGLDLIDGGAGDDLLRGGADADIFVFGPRSGADVLLGFRDGQDLIDVSALGLTDFGQIDVRGGPGKTTLDFGGGNSVDLIGVAPSRLDASDFLFA